MSEAANMGEQMTFKWDPIQRGFLDAHKWGVLATAKKDGSPQQSMVGYILDEQGRLLISVKSYTAKWNNALRESNVSLTVPDDRSHLVIYGQAEAISADPLRAKLTADVFAALSGSAAPELDTLTKMLDSQKRTVLRISANKALFTE